MRSRNDWLIRDDGDWHQTATIEEFQYMPAQQPNVSSCSLSSPTVLKKRIGKTVSSGNDRLIRCDGRAVQNGDHWGIPVSGSTIAESVPLFVIKHDDLQ